MCVRAGSLFIELRHAYQCQVDLYGTTKFDCYNERKNEV
jgi:hypothetical protein